MHYLVSTYNLTFKSSYQTTHPNKKFYNSLLNVANSFLACLVHLPIDDGGDGRPVALLDEVLHRRRDPLHAQQLQPKIMSGNHCFSI